MERHEKRGIVPKDFPHYVSSRKMWKVLGKFIKQFICLMSPKISYRILNLKGKARGGLVIILME